MIIMVVVMEIITAINLAVGAMRIRIMTTTVTLITSALSYKIPIVAVGYKINPSDEYLKNEVKEKKME